MFPVPPRSASKRRLVIAATAIAVAGSAVILPAATAAAQPATPSSTPKNTSGVSATHASQADAANGLIDSDLLESLQPSIVGLVIIWKEQDPFGFSSSLSPASTAAGDQLPAMAICTGWFDTPTTIVTAGHCVDPKEGRQILDDNDLQVDPNTGELLPPPVRPEPQRTVIAFQPRELPGAVITAPTTVRVDSFRPADEGDTARLAIDGMPAGHALPIAQAAPRLGEPVTSIGFPALNIGSADGINLDALLRGGKTLAEVLQDSRLQPVSTSGTIISRQYRDGVGVYQVNSDLGSGESGGPTVNSHGEVYGVNSKMTIFGQNFNIITDTGLRELHDHTGQPREAQTSGAANDTANDAAAPPMSEARDARVSAVHSDAPTGLPVGWITLITGLGAAILGGATASLVLRSRRRSSPTSPSEPEPAAEEAGDETPADRERQPASSLA